MKHAQTVRAVLFLLALCAAVGINSLFDTKTVATWIDIAWIAYVIVAGGLLWTRHGARD